MSILKPAVLGFALPLVLAAPLWAQPAQDGPRLIFEEVDLNNNGAITLDEMQTLRANRFAQADSNGDGRLTRSEMTAQAQGNAERRIDRMIERADSDGDGALTLTEITQARATGRGPTPEQIFTRMDTNQDGQVTEAEFDTAIEAFMNRHGAQGHGGNRG